MTSSPGGMHPAVLGPGTERAWWAANRHPGHQMADRQGKLDTGWIRCPVRVVLSTSPGCPDRRGVSTVDPRGPPPPGQAVDRRRRTAPGPSGRRAARSQPRRTRPPAGTAAPPRRPVAGASRTPAPPATGAGARKPGPTARFGAGRPAPPARRWRPTEFQGRSVDGAVNRMAGTRPRSGHGAPPRWRSTLPSRPGNGKAWSVARLPSCRTGRRSSSSRTEPARSPTPPDPPAPQGY